MKKIITLILFIFALSIYLLINNKQCSNKQAKKYLINSKNYCLLTASNQEQWEKGLMFYKKPVNFDGMIFIFPNKETRSFWNKNTYLDLDLYWMNEDKIVGKSFLPSILKSENLVTISSEEEINRVVEIVK
ncbi:conserved hypothetical protein [Candidatus Roizmanbacteria bacterium]|nr:conserved hypothetical protein [Candidatus Roizmanbacteria bacterium]